ncbi:MAG: hypothetical protein WC806_00355 [Candidatus Gracilibacteria bacterium]|jgi:hypothetical protein
MEVSYNLRYQKSNFSNRLIIDKEGEVIIYAKGFRLKGKGANDKGELINFSDLKEFYSREDSIIFVTFTKEKYVLLDVGNLFDQLLIDIYKARNEFLVDALFMKKGKLKVEFEGNFERLSKFGKPINKGHAKIKLFEKSMVIIPQIQDAFFIHYDFVNFHEFDELDYLFKIVTDDGSTILISQLGNDYEIFEEKMNELLGGMYESLVNDVLKGIFVEFHSTTLLKFAYKMKGGKAVSLKEIQKIDKDLAKRVEEFIFEKTDFKEKIAGIEEFKHDENIYFGIAKDETINNGYIKWVMYSVPQKNIACFSIMPRFVKETDPKSKITEMFFYKIIIEQGDPVEKLENKICEINQALIILSFSKDPCYKDKRELKHSPYKYAIRKLPFLRILRKSFVSKLLLDDKATCEKQIKEIFEKSKI